MNIIDTAWGVIILICVLKYGFPILDAFMRSTMKNLNDKEDK